MINERAARLLLAALRQILALAQQHTMPLRPDQTAQILSQLLGAAMSFDEAASVDAGLRDLLASEGMDHELARWSQRFGEISWAEGRYEAAHDAYTRARGVYASLGLRADAGLCEHGLGLVHAARGRLDSAERAYRAAQETFVDLGMHRMEATSARNLGGLLLDLGRLPEAESSFGSARRVYADLGLVEYVVRCDISLSYVRRKKAAKAAGSNRIALIEEALDLLIPAILTLDSMRFEFSSSQTRGAWNAGIAEGSRAAFEMATELNRPRLVAELIEVWLNVGVHSTENAETASQATSPAHPTTPATPIAGAARLVTSAMLPLEAPPRLRMPDGSVALERYFDQAAVSYGVEIRSNVVIDAW
ncbi:tetratricopeptide repeat protein [Streptosporangiaceae bacterium NEAU-GS5]|nr:tetratricopeptide repeat protein [Streptosporangiaceae bacterium NEAU-GS5]